MDCVVCGGAKDMGGIIDSPPAVLALFDNRDFLNGVVLLRWDICFVPMILTGCCLVEINFGDSVDVERTFENTDFLDIPTKVPRYSPVTSP